MRFRVMRDFIATLAFSQGVPMLSHGDEIARTQRGNNNAYAQDNETTWMHWELDDRRRQLLAFTRKCLQSSPHARRVAPAPLLSRRATIKGGREGSLVDPPRRREMTDDDWQDGEQPRARHADLRRRHRRNRRSRPADQGRDAAAGAQRRRDVVTDFALPTIEGDGIWAEMIDTAHSRAARRRRSGVIELAPLLDSSLLRYGAESADMADVGGRRRERHHRSPSRRRVERLLAGDHANPHAILGAHPATVNGRPGVDRAHARVRRRASRMRASGWPRGAADARSGAACRICSRASSRGAVLPLDYRLRFHYADGAIWERGDPYRFLPTLGDVDLHLFNEGTHRELWKKLGAHVRTIDGVRGVSFAVWAPNARRVSVVGDFCGWDGRIYPMRMLGSSGVWELFVPDVEPGALYKFEILTREGDSRSRPIRSPRRWSSRRERRPSSRQRARTAGATTPG